MQGDYLQCAPEPFGQRLDRRPCGEGAEQIHRLRRHPAYCCGPRRATFEVFQHLDLVDHRDIDRAGGVDHLDGAGDVGGVRGDAALFAGNEAHRHAALDEAFVVFQRKKAQRRKVAAGRCAGQRLHRAVSLAGVGGAENRHEAAPHGECCFERFGVAGEADGLLRNRGPARGVMAGQCFGEAVFDDAKTPAGKLLARFQGAQEGAAVEPFRRRPAQYAGDEVAHFLLECTHRCLIEPLAHQRQMTVGGELAPFLDAREYALLRHEAVRAGVLAGLCHPGDFDGDCALGIH